MVRYPGHIVKIRIEEGLPFVTVSLAYRGQNLEIENVLLDTGSLGTVFSADKVLEIDLQYDSNDMVHRIRSVGGSEFVFTKKVERLSLDELQVDGFEVEIGAMDYGFPIDGIIGMDFLTQVGAVINLNRLEVYKE